MDTAINSNSRSFLKGLAANGPAAEYADQLMLYGQFVGDWLGEMAEFAPDGSLTMSRWDIRFDWVLEGRAIQDLWITPVREDREVGWFEPGNRYSTTLRVYDPTIDAWHIIWINPPGRYITRQLARKVGNEIIQLADVDASGALTRWVYRDITPESFRWCNERSIDQGKSWQLVQDMRAQRLTGGEQHMSEHDRSRRRALELYLQLLDAWNRRSADDFAELFGESGSCIGFDGSPMNGASEITSSLRTIFEHHPTATYVAKVREVRSLGATVTLVRGVAGMIPPGKSEINAAVNAIQSLVVVGSGPTARIALFHNTPAAFHGRPELSERLTMELAEVVRAGIVVDAANEVC